MRFLKKITDGIAKENDMLQSNRSEVEAKNRKMLTVVSSVGFIAFFILFLVTYLVESYSETRTPNLLLALSMGMLWLFSAKKWGPLRPTLLFYISFACLFCFCTYTSCFLTPDHVSAIVLALLIQVPLLLIDKSINIIIAEIGYASFYLCFAIPNKVSGIVFEEVVNVVLFSIITLIIGHHLRRTRLENLELVRQGILRETTDTTTGLYNRRKLFDTIAQIEHDKTHHQFCAIAMIDVDKFKLYNDMYGHQAGDQCLSEIGACFTAMSQTYRATFYRYGGEEFVVLFENDEANDSVSICRDLNEKIHELKIVHQSSPTGFVSISIGLAYADVNCACGVQTWISQADAALYKAKSRGRNTMVLFQSEEMDCDDRCHD